MYQYQVSFGDAINRAFSQYCNFYGRASRSEFWWFYLFTLIIGWALGVPGAIMNFKVIMDGGIPVTNIFTILANIANLVMLLPSLGLTFRRLHDTGRSGWNICWSLLPIVGWIILIVYLCQESQMAPNKYGPVPNIKE